MVDQMAGRLEFPGREMTLENADISDRVMPPYFKMIGMVATDWALLEQMIDDVIWTLAKVDHKKGACITAQIMSTEWKLRALIALVKLYGGGEVIIKNLISLQKSQFHWLKSVIASYMTRYYAILIRKRLLSHA